MVLGAGAAFTWGATPVLADTYTFTVNSAQSTLSASVSASAPFTGTFIGTAGTETRPGLFGGSGNHPIGFTGTGMASGTPMTHPAGVFTLSIDTANNTAFLTGLSIDLLGGAHPTIAANATITYSTFHTVNPTGIFPSLTIPIDLGDAVVNTLTATQVCSGAQGTLTSGPPGLFLFSVPTPVTIASAIDFAGQPVETSPQIVPVVVAGTLAVSGSGATVSMSLHLMDNQTIMGPIPGPQDAPFDLANPLGGTVHLLLSMTITSATFDLTADLNASAAGVAAPFPCVADFDQSGAVNSQDFFDFLAAFFAGDADFNCSGATDSQDFFDFLGAFFAGC